MKGTYYYKYAARVYPLVLESHAIPVEVEQVKGKRYLVRYLAKHKDGHAVGSLHWVQQRKVKLDRMATPPPDNINLPYKDE